jgi:hypothetical protein
MCSIVTTKLKLKLNNYTSRVILEKRGFAGNALCSVGEPDYRSLLEYKGFCAAVFHTLRCIHNIFFKRTVFKTKHYLDVKTKYAFFWEIGNQ